MRTHICIVLFLIMGIFTCGVPAYAAVLDSQLDDSAQAIRPPDSYYWVGLYARVQVINYLAIGYVPPNDISISGARFRINTSDSGEYVCPSTLSVMQYYGTSTPPALWDSGAGIGSLINVATTTPDANGNCDYLAYDRYGRNEPLVLSPNYYYVFFFSTSDGTWGNLNWVSMSGKPQTSTTTQSSFGYRPATDNRYVWGTMGLSVPYFEFFDTAPPSPPPPGPCIASNSCVSNVMFLPGLEASRLYRPDYSGGTDQLWEPNIDGDGNDLLLTVDGRSVRNDVYTKDVIDEAYGAGPNIYKSFIDQMNGLKTAGTIADWEAVPYDWRLSLDDILNSGNQLPDGRVYYSGDLAATSSPYIVQELRRLAKGSKTGKVTIVAHSNGGLVTKALIEKLGSTEAGKLIDKIIFIAVPQAGTPQAIGALLHGYDQGLPKDWLSIFLSPSTARTLAENMPSAYNLLPSVSYFTSVDTPVVTFDNSDLLAEFRARYGGNQIHDEAQLRNFITDIWRLASSSPSDLKYPSVGNATLLSRAEALHTTLDMWAPPQGISLYEVAGWGEDTLATIEYSKGKKAYCSNPWDIRTCSIVPTIIYNPKEVVEGDGTVLVPSALWSSASTTKKYWVDLMEYNGWFGMTKHSNILEIPELRTLVQDILTNSTSTLPQFIYTTQPAIDVSADKRLRFVLHSPLNLSATNALGNIVNSATSTIPGSRWKRYGEVQVLTVPAGTPLTLNLDGYATGSFTLDMQEIGGDDAIIASSSLQAVPSATSTKATMSFTDGTIRNASPLLLDYDGNSTTDFSLAPRVGEAVVFDITPPEATLTFDPVSRQFRIVGTDNLSSTTVSTTATSTTITDEAGNTLQIVFKKLKQEKGELKLEVQELRYNGVVTPVQKTTIEYEWSIGRQGDLKELEEKVTVGSLKIEGHYDAKKNVTMISEKVSDREEEKDKKRTLLGLVIMILSTDDGKINITY